MVLLRGINVGGKNLVSMASLRALLERLGYSNVSTYIASGNVFVESDKRPTEIKAEIEQALPSAFKLDAELIKVRVLSRDELEAIVKNKPEGFGEQPTVYHTDAIFLIEMDSTEAMSAFDPREGVDTIWPGHGVIYSQRLSSLRTQSRLNKLMGKRAYRSMTIRSWQTTTALLDLMKNRH